MDTGRSASGRLKRQQILDYLNNRGGEPREATREHLQRVIGDPNPRGMMSRLKQMCELGELSRATRVVVVNGKPGPAYVYRALVSETTHIIGPFGQETPPPRVRTGVTVNRGWSDEERPARPSGGGQGCLTRPRSGGSLINQLF